MAIHFRPLTIARVTPDAAGSAAFTLAVPPELREAYDFRPGQFLTLRAAIDGRETRRSYSICSPHQRYLTEGEIDIGIKGVEDGVFSRWALAQLRPGMAIDALPPDGRFTPRLPGARHRVGFVAGSGITPILSIMASTLAGDPDASFTLVYGNQRMNTIMFNEILQDLKDAHPARLALIHLLSRQPQEVELLNGRIDEAKVTQLLNTLLPPDSIDEAFLCGPEDMIDAARRALTAAGVAQERIHSERFIPVGKSEPMRDAAPRQIQQPVRQSAQQPGPQHRLEVVLDGKIHQLMMGDQDKVLDVALEAGLDLPYSCRGGVCCTCRARVLQGQVEMEKNFTLEQREVDQGFVLTCQARPLSDHLLVSFDDR
jgi:ring-1,2-phenylacetyl-CoA epoxidase subunit PaaE